MGDIIHALPAVATLKHSFPGCENRARGFADHGHEDALRGRDLSQSARVRREQRIEVSCHELNAFSRGARLPRGFERRFRAHDF